MLKDPRQMITDTTFKTLTLAIATYIVFFAYSVSKNPVLECLLTILLMINLSILTYATSQNDFMETHFRQEIYDDEPMNGCDDDEDEDDECECETPRTNEAEQDTATLTQDTATLTQDTAAAETATLTPQAATPPWPVMLTPEELAKVNLDLTVNNEPPPFSVRALVRALDSKTPLNPSDLSGGVAPLPSCSHDLSYADISGATM
jgi:hypothetical protein